MQAGPVHSAVADSARHTAVGDRTCGEDIREHPQRGGQRDGGGDRHTRTANDVQRDQGGGYAGTVSPVLVRGAGASGKRGGDGAGGGAHEHTDSDGRTACDEVRVLESAGEAGGSDNPAGCWAVRRDNGGEEDSEHSGGALRGDRAAHGVRAGGGRGGDPG